MRRIKVSAVAAALTLMGAAHAQEAPAPARVEPPADMMRGPDERLAELTRLRNNAATSGPTRSARPVPITPDDVTAGREVRDSKGVVIGTIDRVGMGFAVIASPGGKIEVEFASLAKNDKGLLINMPKARFDAIVAGGKPKN